jgi:hypothetical protein
MKRMLADCSCEFPVVRRRVSDHDSTSAATGKLGETPIAVAALHDGEPVADDELIAYARERMAHFKCPPASSSFVNCPGMPLARCSRRRCARSSEVTAAPCGADGRTSFHIPLGGMMWI